MLKNISNLDLDLVVGGKKAAAKSAKAPVAAAPAGGMNPIDFIGGTVQSCANGVVGNPILMVGGVHGAAAGCALGIGTHLFGSLINRG